MSCTSCSTKNTDGGVPNGCKSNGSCGTGSCDKLTVFDWLSNMELPTGQKPFDIVEIRFKNGRKHFFKNEKNFQLTIGEVVAVEGSPGHDIGTVSLTGELVKIQMKKKKIAIDSDEVKKIYRKATEKDIDTWQRARARETETQKLGREIIIKLKLKMKLSDVEYQGDGNKATFYYTADERVDFRQLIKDLASTFSIRIEMRQVGLRQEAARLGGIGSCGRELCCSTWLTDFRKVNTAAARYQQLSLNPLKLAGQCGKLKCCLNYELDTYLDALKEFPSQSTMLKTEKGMAIFIKMDIFKGWLWYTYKEDKSKWFKLTLSQVQEIIAENKNGNAVESLEEYNEENIEETKIDFENVVGQDSLTRFDEPKRKKKRRNNNNRSKNLKARNPQRNSNPKSKVDPKEGTTPQQVKKPHQKRRPNKNHQKKEVNSNTGSEVKNGGNTPKRRPQRKPQVKNNTGNLKPHTEKQAPKNNNVQKEGQKPKTKRPNNNRRRPNKPKNGSEKSE